MLEKVLIAALTLGALALVIGGLLAVASRVFAVHVDERIGKIEEILPHANCGGCGFAGCTAFANAVIRGDASPNACTAGGAQVAEGIAKILGVEVDTRDRYVAHVYCSGGNLTAHRFNYTGVQTCYAASRTAGGPVECSFACLGYGDCVQTCQFNAIYLKDGHAIVNRDLCVGCGKCVAGCPRKTIALIPLKKQISVNCSSRDRGAYVRGMCEVGCIGCKICEKKCTHDAIHVTDNLARIDYDKCTGCGECMSVCPRGIIRNEDNFFVVASRDGSTAGASKS